MTNISTEFHYNINTHTFRVLWKGPKLCSDLQTLRRHFRIKEGCVRHQRRYRSQNKTSVPTANLPRNVVAKLSGCHLLIRPLCSGIFRRWYSLIVYNSLCNHCSWKASNLDGNLHWKSSSTAWMHRTHVTRSFSDRDNITCRINLMKVGCIELPIIVWEARGILRSGTGYQRFESDLASSLFTSTFPFPQDFNLLPWEVLILDRLF